MKKKIACLLLAAGKSSRMQGTNKLLLDIGGQSLILRSANEALKANFCEVAVVTGFQSDLIQDEIESLPLTVVFNPHFSSGMHSSIRKGLEYLSCSYDAFVVCLADQPNFNYRTVLQLIERYERSDERTIIYPTFNGERGNPVLIPASYVSEIFAEPDGDHGCLYLLKRHWQNVTAVEVGNKSVLLDIDSPEDYFSSIVETQHAN
ncbi:MAG: NTP transferase domain-containing protein [Pseudobdellovibrionaceae bacterium]